MATEIIMQKVLGRLVPETGYDAELLDALPSGKSLRCKVTQLRSDPHQRFYWKMLSIVVQNTEFPTSEALHFFLRIRTGRVDHVTLRNGEAHLIPKSTSYGSMDQRDFLEYTEAAKEVICTEVMPGVTIDELLGEMGATV